MRTYSIAEAVDLVNRAERAYQMEDPTLPGIEPGIRNTVIAIRAHGLRPSASCEGHIEPGPLYPWILFNTHPRRIQKRRDFVAWADYTDKRIAILKSLIDEFYETRQVAYDKRLRVWYERDVTPHMSFHLESRGPTLFKLDGIQRFYRDG